MLPKLKIVCLCGPVKFKQAFIDAEAEEKLACNIVLMPTSLSAADIPPSPEMMKKLVSIHNQKIVMADEIRVVVPYASCGTHTKDEIDLARSLDKLVRFTAD